MSTEQSVWPDGAREAVTSLLKRDQSAIGPNPLTEKVLTALEPFVQQRIAAATGPIASDRHAACWAYDQCEAKLRVVEAQEKLLREERDALRAEVARLNEDGSASWECINMAREKLAALLGGKPEDIAPMFLPEAINNAVLKAHRLTCRAETDAKELREALGRTTDKLLAAESEVARLREDGERRQSEVLQLRALVAALPIGECQESAALQGWWDQMKAVMAGTNPVWLVEPRGCPTPGACSCPGVRLDAARSAPGGEG